MNRHILTLLLLIAACGDDTSAPLCGDGVLGPAEVCDGQLAQNPLSCQDFGFLRGEIGCSADCLRPITNACVSVTDKIPACGDEILDPGEECDTTLPPMMDCVRLGYAGGQLACAASCTLDYSGCGDAASSTDDDPDPDSDPTACPEGSSLACYEGAVWSYSCGQRTAKSKDCGTSGPTGESFCMGDSLYILHEEVGCDVDQCTSQTAPKLQKTCTNGCANGSCVECSPSQDYYSCSGGDVYWYDACGLPSGLKQDCGSGSCINGACVECGDGEVDVQGCDPGVYCPPGDRTRQCIDNAWSGWGACEADGNRYYGDGAQRCGAVLCLTVSPTGAGSSLPATVSKVGGGNFDNDIYLVIYSPGTGDDIIYGCVPTQGKSSYNFDIPMSMLDIDLGDTLQVNAQIFSPCNNGGFHITGDASVSQCTE
jgi:hypothetical protein